MSNVVFYCLYLKIGVVYPLIHQFVFDTYMNHCETDLCLISLSARATLNWTNRYERNERGKLCFLFYFVF